MIFHNKRYFQKQSLELLGKSLKIHKKGLFDEIEYEIPLEHIQSKKIIQTQINNNLIVTGILCFVLSFLFLPGTAQELTFILALFGFILTFSAFVNRKKTVTISAYSGDQITLFFNRSNKQDVLDYSTEIIKASNNYLLNKYTKIDKALPVDPQIEHLQFLLDREIISESQFESLKNQLMGREGRSSIGFG